VFLRIRGLVLAGNGDQFFDRVSQRIGRLFQYNEGGFGNLDYTGSVIETETLQRFKFRRDYAASALHDQISNHFSSTFIRSEVQHRLENDPECAEAKRAKELAESLLRRPALPGRMGKVSLPDVKTLREKEERTRPARLQRHYSDVFLERLEVVEAIFRILPREKEATNLLRRDIQRFLVEAGINLDLAGDPPEFRMLDEPLLQTEVIDELLPRLAKRHPDRAREFLECYHRVISGTGLDLVFSEAFKTLEEIARKETGNPSFTFEERTVAKHFPRFHPAIQSTLVKVAAQRGDEAGHGRRSPDAHEIRYLLFAICNMALLILDYPRD